MPAKNAKSPRTKQLTATRLREVLDYDQVSGKFTRRRGRYAGTTAGGLHPRGWRILRVDGTMQRAGRLAWLYMTGEWPQQQIDHANGDRADDRWLNLRPASANEQMHNQGKRLTNKSGFKGVSWATATSAWKAQIGVGGQKLYLGCFPTPEQAAEAYRAAAAKHHGIFARV